MKIQIQKQLKWLVMATALMGLGVAMPSCPGQQAMQQQIDSLQTSQTEMTKRLQAMDAQVKAANVKAGQLEEFAKQATEAIQAQKTALDAMGKDLTELKSQPKFVPPAPAAKKPIKKRGR